MSSKPGAGQFQMLEKNLFTVEDCQRVFDIADKKATNAGNEQKVVPAKREQK